LAIYKDIIPGYRIRPLTEEEQNSKVTKEVKKLRGFEQSLVANYQAYVENLADLSRGIDFLSSWSLSELIANLK
jgi:nucleolar complex protein 3